LYEDDGVTTGYERGESSQTHLTYRRAGSKVTVVVSSAEGGYTGQVEQRSYIVELPETSRPRSISIIPKQPVTNYSTNYDETTHTIAVNVAPRSIRLPVTVLVDF
jgi:hypothetical protein